MKVTLAKSAGFCFGVKRAVDTVYEQIGLNREPIYTYGPIVHNEEVIQELTAKGVMVLSGLSQLKELPKGAVIVRAHGISKAEYCQIEAAGFHLIDATCPFVLKIHRYVEQYSAKGYAIIIIGDKNHPEVQGIYGWADHSDVFVIQTEEEAENFQLSSAKPVCIVSQTTFNYNKFQDLVEIINKKGYDIIVLNTICNATEERQKETQKLARQSDAMIVIGGKNSSNTQKLFEISKKECANTYYIQKSSDMDYSQLKSINNVGITAGASTPNNIIEEVSKNVGNEL